MKFEIDVAIPEGYTPTGRYARPQKGEWYLTQSGKAKCATANWTQPRFIMLNPPVVPTVPIGKMAGFWLYCASAERTFDKYNWFVTFQEPTTNCSGGFFATNEAGCVSAKNFYEMIGVPLVLPTNTLCVQVKHAK